MPFSRHTRRSVFSIGAASLAAAFLFLTPENTHAADTTAKIHILTLGSGSNAIVLESVDDNGQKIFGMVDSGEDWDYPDGSDPRYPLRSGITTSTGYDDEVLSYLDSLGVTSDNLQFYVATHPHSDHIGTGDTIVRLYSPDRVYLLPYDDSYIYNTARLWDNLYVYDQLLTAVEETEGVTLIQHLNPGAASAEEGSPDFAFGNFQIQIVNYEEDYLTSPKEDANQFCLGVIASANDHRAFLTSDIDDVEGDASRIVSNYGLYSIDLMTSNHHGYPNAVDADYLAAVNPEYFIQTGDFRIMDNDTVETLTSLGLRVFSTTEYSGDLPAVIADFSGSAVTSNVDDTYEIYRGRSSKLVAYHDGIPYSGFFTRGGQKYYADSSHLLVCSTSWRDTETGIEYTSDENGVITAKKPGETTITVTADKTSQTCKVTVKQPTVRLDQTSASLYRKGTHRLSVSSTSKSIPRWKTNKKSVATVDNEGRVTAVKNGTAIITVTVDGVSKTCEVTVKKPKITVGQEQISLTAGETCQPKVTVSSGNKPEYYSSNTNVATVNETGMITAIGKGRAYIYAKEDGTKVRMTVTVKEK